MLLAVTRHKKHPPVSMLNKICVSPWNRLTLLIFCIFSTLRQYFWISFVAWTFEHRTSIFRFAPLRSARIFIFPATRSNSSGSTTASCDETCWQVEYIYFQRNEEATGPIVPGTVGNLCLEVRDSQVGVVNSQLSETCWMLLLWLTSK